MGVNWNVNTGTSIVDSVVISQTPPDGPQPVQNFIVGQGTTLFIGLHPNTPYNYDLTATYTDADGNQYSSDFFATGTTKPITTPPHPSPTGPFNVKAGWDSLGLGQWKAKVIWTAGQNTSEYEVIRYLITFQGGMRHETKQADFQNIMVTSFVDSVVPNDYKYEVVAHNPYGSSSAWSNDLPPPPAPPPLPPTAPTAFTANLVSPNNVLLSWHPGNRNTGFDITRERLDIHTDVWVVDKVIATGLGPGVTSHSDTSYIPPTIFYKWMLTAHTNGAPASFSVMSSGSIHV
jgi:hypothetical protein